MDVKIELNLDSVLSSGNVATVICTHTNNATYMIEDGDTKPAFAITFSCRISGGCTNSLDVAVFFFGGSVQSSCNDLTWLGSSKVDVTAAKKSSDSGNGRTIASTYGFTSNYLGLSNIPLKEKLSYLKWFGKFNVPVSEASVFVDQIVTSWDSDSQTVFLTDNDYVSSHAAKIGLLCFCLIISSQLL